MGIVDGDSNADRAGRDDVSLDDLTFEQFEAVLHTTFRVQLEGGVHLDVELMEATRAPAQTGDGGGRNFSVIFKGPADPFLPQRVYSLTHDGMGRFDLFMVPVGKDPDGFQYQAVFNRRETAS